MSLGSLHVLTPRQSLCCSCKRALSFNYRNQTSIRRSHLQTTNIRRMSEADSRKLSSANAPNQQTSGKKDEIVWDQKPWKLPNLASQLDDKINAVDFGLYPWWARIGMNILFSVTKSTLLPNVEKSEGEYEKFYEHVKGEVSFSDESTSCHLKCDELH